MIWRSETSSSYVCSSPEFSSDAGNAESPCSIIMIIIIISSIIIIISSSSSSSNMIIIILSS